MLQEEPYPFRALPVVNPDLTVYLIGDESVVFSVKTQSLYGLNTLATYVLFSLDQGMTPEEVAQTLPDKTTQPAFGTVVAQVAALLAGEAGGIPAPYRAERDLLPAPPSEKATVDGFSCSLIGTRFLLRIEDASVKERVLALLMHLSDGCEGCFDIVVDIKRCDVGYGLSFNQAPFGAPLPVNRVFPVLQDRMRSLAYQGVDYLLAVHGAAVAKGRKGLLMPGESGSGKTTLTAALVADGYSLLTDEAAVVERESRRVLRVPMALGIKQGSWTQVAAMYPGFMGLRVDERWDGLALRHMLPRMDQWYPSDDGCPIRLIVFPHYEAGAGTVLAAVPPVEALRRMTGAGYQIKDRLDAAKVAEILHWLTGLHCYDLHYGSTQGALDAIAHCMETKAVSSGLHPDRAM